MIYNYTIWQVINKDFYQLLLVCKIKKSIKYKIILFHSQN